MKEKPYTVFRVDVPGEPGNIETFDSFRRAKLCARSFASGSGTDVKVVRLERYKSRDVYQAVFTAKGH